jgi:hypothetical protein
MTWEYWIIYLDEWKISHCINSTRNGTETTNSSGSSIYNQQFEIDSLSIQNQKENIANNYKPSVLLFADAITRH